MKPKNIIITNSILPDWLIKDTFTTISTNSIGELKRNSADIRNIYIDESTLSNHPEISSVILNLEFPSKIIIDNIKNITHKFSENMIYKDTGRIPLGAERVICDFLGECMIKNNHTGHLYLLHALYILFSDSSTIYNVKKNIYLPIEIRFDTAEESVERCMKYAIKQGYNLSKKENCNNIFRNFPSIPSNKMFLEECFKYFRDSEIYFFRK